VNSSTPPEPVTTAADEPRTRRQLLTAGGLAVIAGILGAVGLSTPVAARDGDAIRAGQKTEAKQATKLTARKGVAFAASNSGGGKVSGLRGEATSNKGKGVIGVASAKKGKTVGVQGVSASPDGIAGQFTAARGGTAIVAQSPDRKGVALRTEGRLHFAGRSGSSQTSGGSEFVTKVGGGVTEKSLVLATLQDHVPGVYVEAASVLDPAEGLIVVRLNQAVAEPTRVAWFILD